MSRRTRGFALPILMLMLFGLTSVFALASLRVAGNLEMRARAQTERALRQARDALLAYAAREDNVPGTLLCPDYDGDGSADYALQGSPCTHAVIGRFPWRTVGIEAPRDGSGACLWYVLSPSAENRTQTESRAVAINPAYVGDLRLRDRAGGPETMVAALLFAPGPPLGGQQRSAHCSGGSVADFLELGNRSGTPYMSGVPDAGFNDNVLAITGAQLARAAAPQVLLALAGAGPAAEDMGVRGLFAAGHAAATLADPLRAARLRLDFLAPDTYTRFAPGSPPAADAGCARYANGKYPIEWLCYNRWLDFVEYLPLSATRAELRLPGWQASAASGERPRLSRNHP
ncbi:hypothetical protein [Niveibacterium sp. SC-1]|uniref:hypothetical protein n=1 Tax=Niveibacterium sp. SC-1 TaxID=3135646 RepID=UPI00311F1E42